MQAKCKQKAAEKISDAESDIAALKAECRRRLWRVQLDRISEINAETDPADIRRYVQNYADLLDSEPDGASEEPPANNLFTQLEASLNDLRETEQEAADSNAVVEVPQPAKP